MSGGYGFGKKPEKTSIRQDKEVDKLDLTGISRTTLPVDPAREAAAIERGAALGFIDRGERQMDERREVGEGAIRRRRQLVPQSSVYIKGPKNTLDWFIDYTNARAHRSYWQTLEEFRAMVEDEKRN